ncbi:predicted protein [Botrytis cinerea T4]|uniref:Uncharacterized protein n=1 Tax=Botryotinia fuckeliana (strain T4) TaxID=999810 RepID=G2XW77_BOTF4|nr:predicted protein [Botrytis cinerea T4]
MFLNMETGSKFKTSGDVGNCSATQLAYSASYFMGKARSVQLSTSVIKKHALSEYGIFVELHILCDYFKYLFVS